MRKASFTVITPQTERDRVEELLLANFPDKIKPLGFKDIRIINKYKDGSFGLSYLSFMLYGNGCNQKGFSTKYPQGLIYHDGKTLFGIGFFKKDISEPVGHLHLIAPRGRDWLKTVNKFIIKVRTIDGFPRSSIYIRHLSEKQKTEFLKSGCKPVTSDPWNNIAPSEDETFNHRFVKISDIINTDDNGSLKVKTLTVLGSKNFRKKTKMAYNRFLNFLARNKLEYTLEQYHPHKSAGMAKKMIIEYFQTQANAICSTADDYFNLIKFMPEKQDGEYAGFVGYLCGKKVKIPVSFFMGEKIACNIFALYVTFALRNEPSILKKFDPTGYTAISQYTYIRIFDLLKRKGLQYTDLGGSEVEDLNTFKRQFGAIEKKTYWVIKE